VPKKKSPITKREFDEKDVYIIKLAKKAMIETYTSRGRAEHTIFSFPKKKRQKK